MPRHETAGILTLLLVVAGCTGSPDAEAPAAVVSRTEAPSVEPTQLATEPPASPVDDATEPVEPTERSTTVADTSLQRSGSLPSTDLERHITRVLTELGAERRGADTVITLPDRVLFDFDQDTLLPGAAAVLDDLVEVIAFFADAPVLVHGHTDSVGSAQYNQDLSERRAQAVVAHFTSAGVEADRIAARGFGFEEPVAPNTTADGKDDPEGRAQNRRVEIVIEGVDPADLQR